MTKTSKYKKWSGRTLLLIGGISLLSLMGASRLGFDYNFESFFPRDDEDVAFFQTHRELFGSDNDFLLIGVKEEEGVLHPDFLNAISAFCDSIRGLDNVRELTSLLDLKEFRRDPLMGYVFQTPLLDFQNPESYGQDSLRILRNGEAVGTYLSEDWKSLLIQVKTEDYLPKDACVKLANDMSRLLGHFSFDKTHIAGRSVAQLHYVDLMKRELMKFIALSAIVVVLFLFLAFRSFWAVWVPVLVVLLALIWELGFMYLTSKPMDLMLTLLPTIIFVVGMSDVVHIISKYFEELRKGFSKIQAIRVSFREVGLATLLTSITTAMGFLTLLTSNVPPIRSFGLYTAAGVLIAYVLAFTVLPSILILHKKPKRVEIKETFWLKYLHGLFLWVIQKRTVLLWFFAGIVCLSFYGISKIRVDNFLLEDLKDSDRLKQAFTFFEEDFSGVRPFEMNLKMKGDSGGVERLKEMEEIHDLVVEEFEMNQLLSPVSVMKKGNQIYHAGDSRYYSLPEKPAELKKLWRWLRKRDTLNLLSSVLNEQDNSVRFFSKIPDIGGNAFEKKQREFERKMDEKFGQGGIFEWKITGTSVLLDKNNRLISRSMLQGLLIAFLVVGLIVGFLFKSGKWILLAFIPNVVPLLMIAGVMGFSGIELKISTAIVFTIAFGIAVDDSIHLLSRIRLELAKGRSLLYALKRAFISTGKAIVLTSAILCGGFILVVNSDIMGIAYTGLLVSLALFFAVFCDLLLLPVLIILFYKKPPQTKS